MRTQTGGLVHGAVTTEEQKANRRTSSHELHTQNRFDRRHGGGTGRRNGVRLGRIPPRRGRQPRSNPGIHRSPCGESPRDTGRFRDLPPHPQPRLWRLCRCSPVRPGYRRHAWQPACSPTRRLSVEPDRDKRKRESPKHRREIAWDADRYLLRTLVALAAGPQPSLPPGMGNPRMAWQRLGLLILPLVDADPSRSETSTCLRAADGSAATDRADDQRHA